MYATQIAPSKSVLEAKVDSPAWKNKPSWYIIANNDQTVPPDLQRFTSERMGATTIVLESSHVAMISHAKEVLDVVREATTSS